MEKLGFGMMRLPMPDPKEQANVDMDAVCAMVDAFLAEGFTYFDTAYMYHGGQSEHILRQALVERHPRDSFTVADKLPLMSLKDGSAEDQERIFNEQLQKCGVAYFDYYLLHNLNRESYETAKRLDTFAFLLGKKAQGRIRHLGFSFHDKAELLDQILTEHPEVEFVQLQINYLDWEDEQVQSRKCYETAVRHGKQVVIMEPVKGGKLAAVPEDVSANMKSARPGRSPALWALCFAASLEHVMVVLSGMSSMEQLCENMAGMKPFLPLDDGEKKLLAAAAEAISAIPAIACTGCRYCVDGCPRAIPIPDYFALFNRDQLVLRRGGGISRQEYRDLSQGLGLASACIGCKQCEYACPQHLVITDLLERIAKSYEA